MANIFTKGLQTAFFEAFDAAQPVYPDLAMVVNSSAASEDYAWLGGLPGMRKMRGERIPKKLRESSYTLVNEEYEASVTVKTADIKDDQTGKYLPLVRSIGEQARLYPDELIFTLLANGFTSLAYDGQYFFDTDHSEGASGTQSNKLTVALTADNFATARARLMSFKDDQGRPVNRQQDLRLIVPVDLLATAESIVDVRTLSAGGDNPNYQKAKIIVNPYATDANDWFLVNVAGQVKPFVVQEREFIPFESLEDGSEQNFMRKQNYYGTYWRGNAGYALWQKAVGSQVA